MINCPHTHPTPMSNVKRYDHLETRYGRLKLKKMKTCSFWHQKCHFWSTKKFFFGKNVSGDRQNFANIWPDVKFQKKFNGYNLQTRQKCTVGAPCICHGQEPYLDLKLFLSTGTTTAHPSAVYCKFMAFFWVMDSSDPPISSFFFKDLLMYRPLLVSPAI